VQLLTIAACASCPALGPEKVVWQDLQFEKLEYATASGAQAAKAASASKQNNTVQAL
jgi:hypothetical protein